MKAKLKKIFISRFEQKNLNLDIIFKPFYYILSLVGLFPFGIRYKKSRECFKIVRSVVYMNSLCAVSCIIIMYTFFVIHLKDIFSYNEVSTLSNVLITQMNYVLELSTLLICCSVSYFCAFVNRYKYVKILNDISSIFAESQNSSDDKNKILRKLNYQVHVVALGSLFIVLIIQLCVNATRDDSLWKMTMVTFSFILPQMVQMIGLAFHYILVMTLVAVLSDVNQQLLKLTKETKVAENLFEKINYKGSKLTLKHLQAMYTRAFEIKTDINEAFQAPLLVSTIQCFHCIVSESYSIYHGLVAQTHTVHNTINNSIWTTYQLLKVYSLAYSGNALTQEALNVGQTLHKIPTEKQDLRTLLEIQHFSTSMHYREFVLTVYGYFSLDASLIATMVATATMYLIIFVQFDKSNLNFSISSDE